MKYKEHQFDKDRTPVCAIVI